MSKRLVDTVVFTIGSWSTVYASDSKIIPYYHAGPGAGAFPECLPEIAPGSPFKPSAQNAVIFQLVLEPFPQIRYNRRQKTRRAQGRQDFTS